MIRAKIGCTCIHKIWAHQACLFARLSYRHFWWSISNHNTWVRLVIGMVRLIQVQTACDSAPQKSTTLPTQQFCLEIFPSLGTVHGITFRFEATDPGYFLRGCSSWMSVSVCQAQTDEPSDHHRTDGSCYLLLLSSVHLLVLKNLILAGYNQFAISLGWNITIMLFLLPLDCGGLYWGILGSIGLECKKEWIIKTVLFFFLRKGGRK